MEERAQEQYEEIDLREIFSLIKSHIIMIAIVTVICGVLGFLVTKFLITPQYESSVNMIVNTRNDASLTVSNDNISSAKNLVSTYAIIITSNAVLDDVIDELSLNMSYRELVSKVTVTAVNDTQVMRVAVTDPDPDLAADIVRSIAKISPSEIVDAVEAGSCKVISKVSTTDSPVSPSTMRNTAIAALVGMILSIAIVFLKNFLSNYIVDDEDVQKYLGLSVLGVIPEIEEGK